MTFKNIFFGFFKTLLLAVIFYSSLLYAAGNMFLELQGYPYTNHNFRPYFFTKDATTGDLIKIPGTQDSFQFKTYNLGIQADVDSYNAEVKPVLLEWSEEGDPFEQESVYASRLSNNIVQDVERDLDNGMLSKEVHVATYEGRIEAASYAQSPEITAPEIETIAANPAGLITDQTTVVKGGGSALLDSMARTYKEEGVDRIRLYSSRHDNYYADRGWQSDTEDGACGGLEIPPLFPELF